MRKLTIILAVAAAGGSSSYAASIGTTLWGEMCFGPFASSDCPVNHYDSSVTGLTWSASGSASGLAPAEHVLYYAMSGSAGFGVLKASATEDGVSGDRASGTGNISMEVAYTEGFVFTGRTGAGTAYFTMDLHGSGSGAPLSQPPGPFGYGFATYYLGPAPITSWSGTTPIDTTVNIKVRSKPVPFIFGEPVFVAAALAATGNANCLPRDSVACLAWSSSATAQFGDTAILSGIEIMDSNGQPVSDFQISSVSGTAYTPNGVVPEPGNLLAGVVVLALVAYRRGRREARRD